MPSNAYDKFSKTINRCETLVRSYAALHTMNTNDPNVPAPKDILRGAVVLAVAALDTYVTDVFAEKLALYLKKYTPDADLIELLSISGLDTREALNLLAADSECNT